MNFSVRLLLPCLCLFAIFVRPAVGEKLIYCPPPEEVCFDHHHGVFASGLMPGMPLSWKKLQSVPGEDDGKVKAMMSKDSSVISFYKVSVREFWQDDLLVSQLSCHYHVKDDFYEAIIELKPDQNFLEASQKLSFPVYLKEKTSNECSEDRLLCGFVIPDATYRHRLVSEQTCSDSNLGSLIFSYLWVTKRHSEQGSYPLNLTSITHLDQAPAEYYKIPNTVAGITAFKVVSNSNVKTEKRSDILFMGPEGTSKATDYLAAKNVGPAGEQYFCNKANFEDSLARNTVAVMDVVMRLGEETADLFNCSMYVSERAATYEFKHDEL